MNDYYPNHNRVEMNVKVPKRNNVTMHQVAERVGMSIQTVSAVINGKPGISAATTARMLEAVSELGYRSSAVARSLRTRQTHTIALFVSDIATSPLAAMVSAIEEAACQRGYSLQISHTHNDLERERHYIQQAVDRWVDGVIIVAIDEVLTDFTPLTSAGIPVVAVDRVPAGQAVASVALDNRRVGVLAAQHLLGLGHRRLGLIAGPHRLSIARDNQAGFAEVCSWAGATLVVSDREGDWHAHSGYQAMQRLLEGIVRPSGVFVASDLMAVGAMHAVYDAGLSVPRDISIMGVDNIELAAHVHPPLTTISQPFGEIGAHAVEMLLDRPDEATTVRIEPQLILRASTTEYKEEHRQNTQPIAAGT